MRCTALALTCATLIAATPARAVPWSQAFAADTDTVVFLGQGGELVRAPFNLATRETLWAPGGLERVSRFRVSPDGRRVAWLARASDQDTTRLWVAGVRPASVRVRLMSLQPVRLNALHYETATPTLEDLESRGARFIAPSLGARRFSANTLEWTQDGGSVVFGFDDGIAVTPADSGQAIEVSAALIAGLRSLDPSPLFLARTLVLRGGVHVETWYLLYPSPGRWKLFPSSGLDPNHHWVASVSKVWWADGKTVRAVRVDDPTPAVEIEAASQVTWLGYDAERRSLLWAAGNGIYRRSEEGGEPKRVALAREPIRRVLEIHGARHFGILAGDSLMVWDSGTDSTKCVVLGGLDPTALFEAPDGGLIAACSSGRHGAATLARAEFASRRLAGIETPATRNGVVFETPGGARLVLIEPGPRPPVTLHAFDLSSGAWTEVENPGITGWEPLRAR